MTSEYEGLLHRVIAEEAYGNYIERTRLPPADLALEDWFRAVAEVRNYLSDFDTESFESEVALRAHEYYQLRLGGPLQDWLKAERRVFREPWLFGLWILLDPIYEGGADLTVYEYDLKGAIQTLAESHSLEVNSIPADSPPVLVGQPGLPIYGPVPPFISDWLGATAAAIAAAGGARELVKLLGLWIEARKGRTITIKKGDMELTIAGTIKPEQVEKVAQIFAHHVSETHEWSE